jgi:hypothetical protein
MASKSLSSVIGWETKEGLFSLADQFLENLSNYYLEQNAHTKHSQKLLGSVQRLNPHIRRREIKNQTSKALLCNEVYSCGF